MANNDFDELNPQFEGVSDPTDVNISLIAPQNRVDDELDKVLATLPKMRARPDTMARVLARIATLPQLDTAAAALSVGMVPPPKIKYAPPLVQPYKALTAPPSNAPAGKSSVFNPFGYLFIGLWVSACITVGYVVWPAVSNLLFGPSQDPDMQARLLRLQNWGSNVLNNFVAFFDLAQPYIPTIVSALAGILIMLYVFSQQRRRLWMDN